MIEGIVLGTVQGISEWLPISSEALIILLKTNVFGNGAPLPLSDLIEFAIALHLGTFFAAAWYLRDDVRALLTILLWPPRIFSQKKTERETIFRFLLITTLLSGAIGYVLLEIVLPFGERQVALSGKLVTMVVGILLLVTGFAHFRAERQNHSGARKTSDLQDRDALLLGLIQGFTALPGLSRSGLTISTLLLRKYSETTALRLSFLMSLPVVLASTMIFFWRGNIELDTTLVFGILSAFVFGILTIHGLFRLAQKIRFAYFVFLFGILTIASVFL